jgi:hypothetical protein
VRERFAGLTDDVRFEQRSGRLEFASLEEMSEFFDRFNGPQIALRNIPPPEDDHELLREMTDLSASFNQADDGSVRIDAGWLPVVARKPA